MNRMSLHKSLHKMCKTSWWKKFACCVSVRDFEPKILITGVHLTIKKNNCLIESFFQKKGIHIINPKKQKKVYATILLFILYSICVHVESPIYKMICLKSPKSSKFAIFVTNSGQKFLIMFISSIKLNFKERKLKK